MQVSGTTSRSFFAELEKIAKLGLSGLTAAAKRWLPRDPAIRAYRAAEHSASPSGTNLVRKLKVSPGHAKVRGSLASRVNAMSDAQLVDTINTAHGDAGLRQAYGSVGEATRTAMRGAHVPKKVPGVTPGRMPGPALPVETAKTHVIGVPKPRVQKSFQRELLSIRDAA